MFAHIFIFECFFAPKNNMTHDINHRNGVKNCNELSNLELLNKKDHARATRAQYPDMGIKTGKSLSHPFTQILETGERVRHESIREAVKNVNGASRTSISNYLSNGKKYLNCHWEYIFVPDLENEIWKSPPDYNGIEVSSAGRIRSKTGIVTSGSPSPSGYKYIKFNRKNVFVHILICLAFHGPKPTPKHTVDHRDKNKSNNCAENLRWATKFEQAKNRSSVKAVSAFTKDGTFFKTWETAEAAGKEIGIDASNIGKCCYNKKHNITAGGYKWVFTANVEKTC
jgi:hypothetical protein